MAICKKVTLPEASQQLYSLNMNEEEARTLMAVVAMCGGKASSTRRGITDNILTALESVGLDYDVSDIQDRIMFVTREQS